ncbi:MAG TPA: L,D-transpeptidase family protein [Thermomicrobiales bacterium]|nr:L,D-transpeptidase family protein [Thermomicrobiales bacterium]
MPNSIRLVCAIVALAGVAAGFAPDHAAAAWPATIAADAVNVRAEPGLWSDVVGQAWAGQTADVLDGPSDGWYQVAVDGVTGWIDGAFLMGGDAGAASSDNGRWVDVDRSSQMVTLFDGDAPVASFWGAMGSDPSADGFYATAVGVYSVYSLNQALTWTDWGQAWIRDWVGFDPDRQNGFHTFSMDADGTVLPNGAAPTGGCVALAPGAANQLFAFVTIGTPVVVHW